MNLYINDYNRKQKEKAVQSFYSVHNSVIVIGKKPACCTKNVPYVSWPKNKAVKSGSPDAGYS